MTSTMRLSRMRASVFACASLIALLAANRALAQDPPPKIGFVVDLPRRCRGSPRIYSSRRAAT
jgi:hypothetical protein